MRIGVSLVALVVAGPVWAQGTTTPGQTPDFGLKDGITLTIAVLGAVLGVLNYWNTISTRRLKVLIKPENAARYGDGVGEKAFSITVVNLSTFPVNVSEIGFLVGSKYNPKQFRLPQHAFAACQPPPYRVDSRDAVSFYFHPYRAFVFGTELGRAYAILASGEVITGTSPALRDLQDEMAERRGVNRWRRSLASLQPLFGIGRR